MRLPAAESRIRDRSWTIGWLALIVLSSLVTFDPKLYISGDNVDYIRLAERARSGDLWASPKFPPLFPWLLALPQTFFGIALLPQKILVAILHAASGALLIIRARRIFPSRWGEPIAWIAMTLAPVLEFGHYVMSEIPFLFFSLLALEAWERIPRGSRWILLCCAAAAATFYTRSMGLAVWAALAAGIAARPENRGRSALLFASFSLALIAPWVIRAFTGPPNPYFRQLIQVNPFHPEWGYLGLAGWLGRIGENLRVYFLGEIPTNLLPAIFRWSYDPAELRYRFLPLAVGIAPLLLLAVGVARSLRRRDPLAVYLLLYLSICAVWPAIWTGLRFLVPVLPLLLVAMFEGILWLTGVVESRFRRRRILALAFLVLWIGLGVKNQASMAARVGSYPPQWDAYFRAAQWVGDHTRPGDRIVDRKPGLLSYATGRDAVAFPREEDPVRMVRWMAEQGIDFVMVPPIPYDDILRYLIPAIQAEQQHFEPVYEIEAPYTVVLRFIP